MCIEFVILKQWEPFFSAMKTEYVVVAEQAYPLGPAYSITNSSIFEHSREDVH